jgi:hypothetical protein
MIEYTNRMLKEPIDCGYSPGRSSRVNAGQKHRKSLNTYVVPEDSGRHGAVANKGGRLNVSARTASVYDVD